MGTATIKSLESRLSAVGLLSVAHIGPLRVVCGGTKIGMCNRGCGSKSAIVCISKRDEVLFPQLGMRVVMRRGDMLMWRNIDWDSGKGIEDLRTLRVHLPGSDGPALRLEASFYDTVDSIPLRERQAAKPLHVYEHSNFLALEAPNGLPDMCMPTPGGMRNAML